MNNDEINNLVAKKLGWTDIKDRSELGYGINWTGKNPNKKDPPMPDGYEAFDMLPDYCGSIQAAWEIIEYISKKLDPNGDIQETAYPDGKPRFMGYGFHLEHHSENSCEKWICTLPEIVCAPPYEEMNDDIQAEADTAPLAICLAFLKLE